MLVITAVQQAQSAVCFTYGFRVISKRMRANKWWRIEVNQCGWLLWCWLISIGNTCNKLLLNFEKLTTPLLRRHCTTLLFCKTYCFTLCCNSAFRAIKTSNFGNTSSSSSRIIGLNMHQVQIIAQPMIKIFLYILVKVKPRCIYE